MVRCRLCLTFEHEPGAVSCSGCRAIRRIRDLYCGGFLVRAQESRGLEILRSCVGALTDLAEEAAPILEKERQESGPSEAATAPKTAGPLGEPVAPVVGRLLESEKEAAEFVKTEEDEKKDEQTTPGVGELPTEGVETEVKAEGEESAKPKKKRKRKHISRGPEQKDRRRRRREKKAEKEVTPAPEEGAVEAAAEEAAVAEPPPEVPAEVPPEVPPPPPEVPERRGPLGLVPAPKGTVSKHFNHFQYLPRPPSPPRRPRSPSQPPPGYHSSDTRGRRGPPSRSRSYSEAGAPEKRRRGSKGVKHRERGIQRRLAGLQ